MKVKIFFNDDTISKLEEKINEFIKDKKILDIKYQISSYSSTNNYAHSETLDVSVLVMYEDKEEK